MTPPEAGFTVEAEPSRKLLRIALRGFWTEETIERYDRALRDAAGTMAAVGCPLAEILCLVDARDLSTQTQQLIADYRTRFSASERQPKRIATVTSSALMKLQAQRLAFPNQRIFDNEQEAVDWLLT